MFCLPLEYMLDNKVIVLGTNGGYGENHPTEDKGKYCEINYFYGTEFQEYVKYNRNAVKLLMKITQAH